MKRKIFIATPTFGNLLPEFVESVVAAINKAKARYDITFRLIAGYAVDYARNMAVQQFMASGCDYLLFIDSDIVFDVGVLDALVASDAEIITSVYRKKSLQITDVELYRMEGDKFTCYKQEEVAPEIFPIDACGFGFILLKREAVEKIMREIAGDVPFKYIGRNGVTISEDIYFCNLAARCDIPILCDGTTKVGHVGKFMF